MVGDGWVSVSHYLLNFHALLLQSSHSSLQTLQLHERNLAPCLPLVHHLDIQHILGCFSDQDVRQILSGKTWRVIASIILSKTLQLHERTLVPCLPLVHHLDIQHILGCFFNQDVRQILRGKTWRVIASIILCKTLQFRVCCFYLDIQHILSLFLH